MWIIPITYKLKYELEKFNENELLDLIEAYLKELNFGIINRKQNYIFFHKGGFFHSLNFRDLLGSGSGKNDESDHPITIQTDHL
jgi:hypothetical protein